MLGWSGNNANYMDVRIVGSEVGKVLGTRDK